MRKITRDITLYNTTYSTPFIQLTQNELTYWSIQAQKFYAQTYSDLDFRVEPYYKED